MYAIIVAGGGADVNTVVVVGGGADVNAVVVAGGGSDLNTVVVAGGTGGGGHDGQSSDDGQGPRTGPKIPSTARHHACRRRRPFLHLSPAIPHRGSLPGSQVNTCHTFPYY